MKHEGRKVHVEFPRFEGQLGFTDSREPLRELLVAAMEDDAMIGILPARRPCLTVANRGKTFLRY